VVKQSNRAPACGYGRFACCPDQLPRKINKLHLSRQSRAVCPYTIATHQAIDALRKRRRHPSVNYDAQATVGAVDHTLACPLQLLFGKQDFPFDASLLLQVLAFEMLSQVVGQT